MSHHCHDEHDHEGHDHGDHVPPPDTNQSQSLYQYIDTDHIRTLNEDEQDSGKTVFKSWDNRLDTSKNVESDCDEQLLFYIPFTGMVKLHSLLLRTANDDKAPKTIKLFKNRQDIDFDLAEELKPTSKLVHPENIGITEGEVVEQSQNNDMEAEGIVEYAVNRAHFTNLQNLTIFIEDNYGADTTKVFYIGLRGDWTKAGRVPVNITYEAAPNPSDHKNPVTDQHQVSENP